MSKRRPDTHSGKNTAAIPAETASKPFPVWVYIGITALFVGIILVARMNLASLPFERDEGSYSYMGQLLLEGKKPYTYFYEMKLPGIFYCYAAIVGIFGKTLEGVHIGFMFLTLVSTALIFLVGRLLFDMRAAAVAAIAFSILSLTKFASGFAAQAEHLVVFWALAGIYFTLRGIKTDKWHDYLIAGFFLGMSFLIKQSGVFFALGAGLFVVFNYLKPLNIRPLIVNGLLMAAGFIVSVSLFVGLVAVQGGWNDMLFWVFEYPKIYISALPFDVGMKQLNGAIDAVSRDHIGLWYFGGAGLLLLWFTNLDAYKKAGVSLLIVLAFLSTAPGMRFYGHYFIQMMPAVALLIAAMVYSAGEISESKLHFKMGGSIVFGVFLFYCAINVNKQSSYYFTPNQFEILRTVYGDNPFVESKPVADKIKSVAKSGDQLLVLGSEPQINFYAQMHTPTRHSFIGFTSGMDENAGRWRAEVKKEVEDAKPAFIVLVNHPFSWSFPRDSDQDLFKWGYSYMVENYEIMGIADIVPGARPVYVWDQAAMTYKPKGEKYMLIFKRKEAQKG